MSQTYQICEVVVTLPSLGTITTDGPGNQIKHGDKCRVHLYAVKPDWRSGGTFEGFIVGWLTHEGHSESPFKNRQKIIMPGGYKLIALSVDERGIPVSWDSLPVMFVGGFITVKDGDDNVRVRIGKIDGIENAVVSSMKMKTALSDEMKQAVIDAVRESDLFTSLQAASASDLQQAVDDAVGKALLNAMRPGGAIWSAISHR
ncbi:hypothetical protein D6914_09865 [Escherichia coli]|uniref:hypothetical protein n=1 Tax=Enterobacter roggenkampii TaxID=1812935 RepID=UPI0020196AE8|nr:hypothetical protein [Enterobacter roggenkampii]EFN8837699.1 hypothetical protein [Escherichia coli]UQQ43585.1 hypothetical protein MUY32_09140 [Enterobacter roggenkampii]